MMNNGFLKHVRAIVGSPSLFTTDIPFQPLTAGAVVATALVDAATITPDCSTGGVFQLTCTSNAARSIQVPTNAPSGAEIKIQLLNTSGGALTLTTFAAGIKQPAAVTYPATAFNRIYTLTNVGGTWYLSFIATDVGN